VLRYPTFFFGEVKYYVVVFKYCLIIEIWYYFITIHCTFLSYAVWFILKLCAMSLSCVGNFIFIWQGLYNWIRWEHKDYYLSWLLLQYSIGRYTSVYLKSDIFSHKLKKYQMIDHGYLSNLILIIIGTTKFKEKFRIVIDT